MGLFGTVKLASSLALSKPAARRYDFFVGSLFFGRGLDDCVGLTDGLHVNLDHSIPQAGP